MATEKTGAEYQRISAELKAERNKSIDETIASITKELAAFDDMRPVLMDDNADLDKLVMCMHNVIAIVPEEQHIFHNGIKRLFEMMPEDVRKQKDVKYAYDRLKDMKKEDLDTKVQITDLSRYWTTYRCSVYKYGCPETDKQIEQQRKLQKLIVLVMERTYNKRKQGIKTGNIMKKQ